MCHQKTIEAVARQEIEYLRRAYAIATDQIGEDTEASVTAGGDLPSDLQSGRHLRRHWSRDATPDGQWSERLGGCGTRCIGPARAYPTPHRQPSRHVR